MKSFLRFIGVIELIAYFAGVVIWVLNMPFVGILIFYFVIYLIMGPTFAVILFAIAALLDSAEYQEEQLRKINKKIDLLSKQDKTIEKAVSELNRQIDEPNTIKFNALVGLSNDDKKRYKIHINTAFNEFDFSKYAPSVKSKMEQTRDEALEMIDDSKNIVEADAVETAFKQALKELK